SVFFCVFSDFCELKNSQIVSCSLSVIEHQFLTAASFELRVTSLFGSNLGELKIFSVFFCVFSDFCELKISQIVSCSFSIIELKPQTSDIKPQTFSSSF